MTANDWKNSVQYKRIIEILEDYWTSEPDEAYVEVAMHFVKADGQYQDKVITWWNPKYTREEVRDLVERTGVLR